MSRTRPIGVFKRFNCTGLWYDFSVHPDSFDIDLFIATTGLNRARVKWSSVCAPKSVLADYHAHFDGQVQSKRIFIRIYYATGSIRQSPGEGEPFAETLMTWLGQFFKNQISDVSVRVLFEGPDDKWRGRFNLPFKVTMSGLNAEVAIDGISMALAKNEAGAYEGTLKKEPKKICASVKLNRKMDFANFKLREELKVFSDVTNLWIERADS
jgi:hypothetical protein